MDVKTSRTAFKRLGRAPYGCQRQATPSGNVGICRFWLAGNCTRNPCKFSHTETAVGPGNFTWNRSHPFSRQSHPIERKSHKIISPVKSNEERRSAKRQNPNLKERSKVKDVHEECHSTLGNESGFAHPNAPVDSIDEIKLENVSKRICEYWVTGNCVYGDNCKNLHSWFYGDSFSKLTQLEGHKKAVTGIVLPPGSEKLYTGSEDGTVRVWNCHTGQCEDAINLDSEVGCLYSEGPWVFIGLINEVKALNIQSQTVLSLTGPIGLVYAMEMGCDMLLAGAQDGTISAWKINFETSSFDLTGSLKGHNHAVVSLVVGAGKLYSGSMDNTIRRWDLATMTCMQILNGHSEVVTSLLCWDVVLLSCSLDRKLKVWAATEDWNLGEYHTHEEEHGIIALRGMHDAEGKPILLCSLNDNSVLLRELPSLRETGRIFARKEMRTIQSGPDGLFFTGDGTGLISVWKISQKPSS